MSNEHNIIPFNRPSLVGRELQYIQEALELGQLSGDGSFTKKCQQFIEDRGVAQKTLLTHSCTAALEMAMILANVGQDDEVIMPSYTFVSTANAACLRGAIPVFVDIDPLSLCLDPDLIENAITDRTKAIVMVHYAGVVFEVEKIQEICRAHNIILIEDAAQALGTSYNGQQAGSFGDLSAFSFHETKNVISGEGGFLGINNPQLIDRAEIIREKGTNRSKFFRGQVDKYTWVDIGSSFLPGELIAAFLLAQLEKTEQINGWRLNAWKNYDSNFRAIAEKYAITLPEIAENCEHNAHMYYLIMKNQNDRANFIAHMRINNIMAPFHYVPLHSAPAGLKFGRAHGELPVTNSIAERLVRLPLYQISEEDQNKVIKAALDFFN